MLKFRRRILQASAGLVFFGAFNGMSALQRKVLAQTPACDDKPTPRQIEGPFYSPQTPKRSNLTDGLPGEILVLEGQVLNTACQPIANAVVDLWSCDSKGEYDNSGFKLRGHQITDARGRFRFQTIKPGAYGNSSFRRTPHLHARVQGPGTALLTTQLYFPDEPLNRQDSFFNPALLLRTQQTNKTTRAARFDFVLPAKPKGES